jgi:sugar lactone lactonase YvrE
MILRYNGTTGAFINAFITSGLTSPTGLRFGGDGNLYVANYGTSSVLRFNGTTGAFMDIFASGITEPIDLVFGPDGHLYVSSYSGNRVARFNGTTGASLGDFVSAGSGGLSGPTFLTFASVYPTAINLSTSATPALAGQTITFTATVNASAPISPTGTITFKDGGVDISGCVNVALNGAA